MDQQELETLETKTKKIVSTLGSLESELLKQKKTRRSLDEERETLISATATLKALATSLDEAVKLLSGGALTSEIARLDAAMRNLVEMEKLLNRKIDELVELDSGAKQKVDNVSEELFSRLDSFGPVLGRIDRNTQKGIGKERG